MNRMANGSGGIWLGELLVTNGLITPEQLQQALALQGQTDKRLGQILVRLGHVTDQDINNALGEQLGLSQVNLYEVIDLALFNTFPEQLSRRHSVVPVKVAGNVLTIAMADPLDVVAIEDIRLSTGYEVTPVLALEKEIESFISRNWELKELEQAYEAFKPADIEDPDRKEPGDLAAEGPVVRLVNNIIIRAVGEQASDIHIEPREQDVRVRFRVDGLLREIMVLQRSSHAGIVSRIKILAEMDIAERRLSQDGRFNRRIGGVDIDLRVSSMATLFGEKLVLRLLNKNLLMIDLDQLGLSKDNLNLFTHLIQCPYGMVLLTGPTGSGKTTTLYAALNKINSPELNLITVEDPVEYVLEGVNQTQVNPKAGLTFASGLRSIVRQDPDVIMVGEIRDRETAAMAVRAANTGHLVLSTMHTNDTAGAVARLADMGIEPFQVASTLLGVVAQRLVRRICTRCAAPYVPPPESQVRVYLGVDPAERLILYRGEGCNYCGHTGYKGRLSIQEIMVMSKDLRNLINRGASADDIKSLALSEGMVSLRADAVNKVRQGITTVTEIMRITYNDDSEK